MFATWNRNRACFDERDTLPWVRIKFLAFVAKMLRVQFHFEGLPFGGPARSLPIDY